MITESQNRTIKRLVEEVRLAEVALARHLYTPRGESAETTLDLGKRRAVAIAALESYVDSIALPDEPLGFGGDDAGADTVVEKNSRALFGKED